MTIGLPEGGCVVSICYIIDDHWFGRGYGKPMVTNNITNRNTQPPSGKPMVTNNKTKVDADKSLQNTGLYRN
jgi:hypothetical protein